MRKKLILLAFLLFALPLNAVKAFDTNEMLFAVQKVMQSFIAGNDFTFLEGILSDEAKIILHVNGKTFERNKNEYLINLKKAYQENIAGVELLKASYSVTGPTTIEVKDQSVPPRKGTGLEETAGKTLYYINDVGTYTFEEKNNDMKLIKMEHTYTKTPIPLE